MIMLVYHEREISGESGAPRSRCRVQGSPLWVAAVVDLSRLTIRVEIGL